MIREKYLLSIFTILILLSVSFQPTGAADPDFVIEKYGKTGDGPGEFDRPTSIRIIDGKYYIADLWNHRIQILDADWNYIDQFGGLGSGNGQLNDPFFFENNGTHIFVGDFTNDRVSIFDHDGNFVQNFGTAGNGNGEFNGPTGISFYNGEIFVSDFYNDRIQVFNASTLDYTRKLGTSPILDSPEENLVVDGILYVADATNDTIHKFDPKIGSYLGNFGESTFEGGHLNYPFGIKYINGHFIVTNWLSDSISIYTQGGEFIREITGGLEQPGDIAITEKHVLVPEYIGDEITKLRMVANPYNVIVRSGIDSISTSWEINEAAGISDIDHYKIYRDSGNGSEFIGTTTDQVFTDFAVQRGVEYTYSVEAFSILGKSNTVASNTTSLASSEVDMDTNSTNGDQNGVGDIISDLPINIIPFFAALLLIPIVRKILHNNSS